MMLNELSTAFNNMGVGLASHYPQASDQQYVTAESPIDLSFLGLIVGMAQSHIDEDVDKVESAQLAWKSYPAPLRGEMLRKYANILRENKEDLASIITMEVGKTTSESLGEVQEMIDICDFAVGLSRQLHGLTITTERPNHKMLETWHPYGICGVISAFNFPMAVWAWNSALALVCGNGVIWKPSEKALLCAKAAHGLLEELLKNEYPQFAHISKLWHGGKQIGKAMVAHPKIRLISATGSTNMGQAIGVECAKTFKRTILELGGNNAGIVCPSANLDLALMGIVFSAVGTCGQRCTTMRRLFVHRSVYDQIVPRIKHAYQSLSIGDPRKPETLVGPLIDKGAQTSMEIAVNKAKLKLYNVFNDKFNIIDARAAYVTPVIIEVPTYDDELMNVETFAPILYIVPYDTLSEATDMNNRSHHGLSSCIFTNDMKEAEWFTSCAGSDCGIVNVNIGTSGAEIGGAFGGEKNTGGGRESGSDSWKQYMRRSTNTINYGSDLPLAQGVMFL